MNCVTRKLCKEFEDIPVSPNLKSRVRQRLFSLVNRIEGFTPSVINENCEECTNHDFENKCLTKKSNPLFSEDASINLKNDQTSALNNPILYLNNINDNKKYVKQENYKNVHGNSHVNNSPLPLKCKVASSGSKSFPTADINVLSEIENGENIGTECEKLPSCQMESSELAKLVKELQFQLMQASQVITSQKLEVSSLEKQLILMKEKHERELEMMRLNYLKKLEDFKRETDTKLNFKKDLNTKVEHKKNLSNIDGKLQLLKREIVEIRKHNMKLHRKLVGIKKKNMRKATERFDSEDSSSGEAFYKALTVEYREYMSAQMKEYKKAIHTLKKQYQNLQI